MVEWEQKFFFFKADFHLVLQDDTYENAKKVSMSWKMNGNKLRLITVRRIFIVIRCVYSVSSSVLHSVRATGLGPYFTICSEVFTCWTILLIVWNIDSWLNYTSGPRRIYKKLPCNPLHPVGYIAYAIKFFSFPNKGMLATVLPSPNSDKSQRSRKLLHSFGLLSSYILNLPVQQAWVSHEIQIPLLWCTS